MKATLKAVLAASLLLAPAAFAMLGAYFCFTALSRLNNNVLLAAVAVVLALLAFGMVPREHLGELVPHQVSRLQGQEVPGPTVRGLDPSVRGHQEHPVGRGVEDLGETALLELHFLVVTRVVHRDRRMSGQAREKLDLFRGELVGLEEVAHQHSEHLVAYRDGNREVGARGGLDDPLCHGAVA